jgi:hypothetical protein
VTKFGAPLLSLVECSKFPARVVARLPTVFKQLNYIVFCGLLKRQGFFTSKPLTQEKMLEVKEEKES